MSRRPPPGEEIVPEQRVWFQGAYPKVIPLRDTPTSAALPSPAAAAGVGADLMWEASQQVHPQHVSSQMCPRNPSSQLQAQKVSPQGIRGS